MVLTFDRTGKYGHKGMWLLLSKSRPKRVLKIFGKTRPTRKRVMMEERRIGFFKSKKGRR